VALGTADPSIPILKGGQRAGYHQQNMVLGDEEMTNVQNKYFLSVFTNEDEKTLLEEKHMQCHHHSMTFGLLWKM
jgi:hypothetical protein